MDWGKEMCVIAEILGFTPSQVFNMTLPQFLLYSRYANEQKFLQIDLNKVNDYLKAFFGDKEGKESKESKENKKSRIPKAPPKKFPTLYECKSDFEQRINNIDNLTKARNNLRERTGRKTFKMNEIIDEIKRISPPKTYKIN